MIILSSIIICYESLLYMYIQDRNDRLHRQPNPEPRQPNPDLEPREPNPDPEARQPNPDPEARQPNPGPEAQSNFLTRIFGLVSIHH